MCEYSIATIFSSSSIMASSGSSSKEFIKRHRRMNSVVIVNDDGGFGGARPRIRVLPDSIIEEEPRPSKEKSEVPTRSHKLPPSPPPRKRQLIPMKLVEKVRGRQVVGKTVTGGSSSNDSPTAPPLPPRQCVAPPPRPPPPRRDRLVVLQEEERPELPRLLGRIPHAYELFVELIATIL